MDGINPFMNVQSNGRAQQNLAGIDEVQRDKRVLPSSMTRDWLTYGVDGINPFMNVQSNGRAQQNLAGIDEVQRDKRVITD
ncbi:hypothetical protein [Mycobacterium tuberculosis]|uniref:hypothetical protein n=1 Tax=Mycobacterium tuberculosis TaxID=1773 RepID=UPI00272A50A8|nr:hypothetical protein [Mycobacterium tuberculosis]